MRVKLFFVMAVALFWSASVFSETTQVPVGAFVNGNELFRVCSDDHHFNEAYCKGYVVGVTDALMAVSSQVKAMGFAPSICPPTIGPPGTNVVPDQVRDVVMQYLTAHPETRNQAAAGEEWKALLAAFPCK